MKRAFPRAWNIGAIFRTFHDGDSMSGKRDFDRPMFIHGTGTFGKTLSLGGPVLLLVRCTAATFEVWS
jgi:hypothetical protein